MKKFINGKMINLADPRLGSKVIFKTDDFFASANRIINPNPPIFKDGVFDRHGKWRDGGETRRRRRKGFDYLIIGPGGMSDNGLTRCDSIDFSKVNTIVKGLLSQ